MAPKRSRGSSRAVARKINHEKWARSINDEAALNALVVDDVLPDRAMIGWCPVFGEEFPTPRTDELVVFEDYFYQGFGVPIHSFLHGLIDYYRISLYDLSPNSILHVAIFINFCEAYLGSFPISTSSIISSTSKSKGSRSRVVGGAYL
jgi:hypothetical protein